MSADLFAAFEAPASNSNSQKNRSQPSAIPAVTAPSDPFSFLATSGVGSGAPHQQTSQQQSLQWQSAPTLTTAPASLWPTALPPQSQNASSSNVWGDLSNLGGFQNASLPAKEEPPKEEDDDWGDFEAPETTLPTPAVPVTNPAPVRTRVVRASTIDMLSNKLVDLGAGTISSTLDSWQERPSWEKSPPQNVPPAPVPSADPNVLFDAADFELQGDIDGEDDDFGDFEAEPPSTLPTTLSAVSSFGATQPTKQPPPLLLVDATANAQTDFGSGVLPGTSSFGATHPKRQPPNLSLASPTTIGNGSLYPQAPKSPYGSFQTRKPDTIKGLKVKTPVTSEFPKEDKSRSPSPVTAWPTATGTKDDLDNDWADFEDLPPDSKPAAKLSASAAKAIGGPDITKLKPTIDTSLSTDTATTPPPANVPPPSVLLSIFPQLLDLATTSLLKPISALPASSQQLVAANEATLIFLKGHLALATVAARIMAGRKHRWHRDKFLMQGMAISAAGGKGGMKLAGIDKTQSAREDREAAEVMSVWKAQVGRLRSAVAAANAAASASRNETMPLKVPELSLSVSAHAVANVVTAPKPCVICGLKREERITKVDFDVEDSFGEWWVEFWGHRACRNFWLQHEVKLRQR